MIARSEPVAPATTAVVSDQYLVSFGASGGLGCFTVQEALTLERGDRVVLRTPRGLEVGEVRGPATLRQARLAGTLAAGDIIRRFTSADEADSARLRSRADQVFAVCVAESARLGLPLQVVDVEILLDGRHAIVQFLGADAEVAVLAEVVERGFDLEIRFENLAQQSAMEEPGQGGCGKPDCGRVDGSGGCTDCGSGGCGTCGAGHIDLRAYFAHLRGKMEASNRIPLA
jgi:cell fate regulator YaaT (PSP1 superfamily)